MRWSLWNEEGGERVVMNVMFSEYFRYKSALRGFDLTQLEDIVRYASERYVDTVTGRLIAIGRHGHHLVMIPYEQHDDTLTPVTVHVVTRQQMTYRLKTERLVIYE